MKYEMNKVEGFNPFDHVEIAKNRRGEEIKKKDGTPLKFLGSSAKILWFRKVYPKGALILKAIDTPHQDFGTIVKYSAEVWLDVADPMPVAACQHQETAWDVAELDNIVSKVQTIALGKALSRAGFGCEVEFELGAVSEGEQLIETDDAPASNPPAEPKKKRGRPKKEETKPETSVEEEVENLLQSVEAASKPEPKAEPEEPEMSDAEKLKQAMETKLTCTENATNEKIRSLEGKTLEEIINQRPSFCSLVRRNPNIRQQLTEETVNAAVYIAENK